jgi:3'-phosphoadenosine 5'-phosphosulfate sulfotransferase (PAPS reductase)/FAD synthetase
MLTLHDFDLTDYDTYIVAFSGGKDSIACFLRLLDLGVPKSKIELWHHCIDGKEGSVLMDWPVTEDYCRKFAEAFEVPLYLSWKTGGFEREMLRDNTPTASTKFETPDGTIVERGGKGPLGTRMRYPQVSANLNVRWCSAYLKIDVCATAINNQDRFLNKRTCVLSGERAEESTARSKYKRLEPDRTDNRNGKRRKRHVDRWRPVHLWREALVWEIISRYSVNPHPAYRLGWGRLSCISCIFGSAHQWASLDMLDPVRVNLIGQYEEKFDCTIHRKKSVLEQVKAGMAYQGMDPRLMRLGLSHTYTDPILVDEWEFPRGAFGESTGPT